MDDLDGGNAVHPNGLDLRMLGPLEATRGGQRLTLGGQRQRCVLACLMVEPARQASTDRIVDAIWGEHPPSGVLTTVQTYVFHLREVLEPARPKGAAPSVIVTVPGGYRLDVPEATIDATRFETLLAKGREALPSDPARATDPLGQALALWRGDVLSDLPCLEAFSPVAARLDEMRIGATEAWVEAELGLGHHDAVSATLDDLVARYPLREHLAGLRMLALYRCGRQSDALAAYRQLRRTLDEELGIRPSVEIEAMHQKILRQDPSLAAAPAALRTNAVHAVETPAAGATRVAAEPTPGPEPEPNEPQPPPEPVARSAAARPGPRRRGYLAGLGRRRWAAIAAIVVVAATGLVGSTFVARRGDITPLPANSVGPVDEHGLRGDAVALDSAPSALVSAGGFVWAALENDDLLVKIDPHSRSIVHTVRGVGGSPQSVATSGDDVWVAGFGEQVVTRINIPTGVVVKKIPVGVEPAAVIAGPDGVWVANSGDNTVQHIDPATEKADPPIAVGDGPDALALDGSTLWVANGRSGTLTQIDTRNGEPAAGDVRVDSGPAALAVTSTDVWVANEFGQSVSRLSKTDRRVGRIEVADGPSSLVVVDDQVWVTNHYSGALSRIDVASNQVRHEPLGSAPSAVAAVDGQVWAAAGAYASAEHRGGTLVWTAVAQGPDTLDPAGGYFTTFAGLVRIAYDGLLAFRLTGGHSSSGLVPDLATGIPEPSDGGRTYVFTIRPGVRYSTGALVKPSDFVGGVQRALLPDAAEPGLFSAIDGAPSCIASQESPPRCDLRKGVVADDANGRLTFHLTRPDPELPLKLAAFVYPVPAGTPVDRLASSPVPGTGPYAVASAEQGNVTLVRNRYFRQWSSAAQPDGYPDIIAYRPAVSQDAGIADVLDGRAQAMITFYLLPASVTSRPVYVRHFPLVDMQYLSPNVKLVPFNDPRARRALSYAVDRRKLAAVEGSDIACQLLPASFPAYRPYCPYQSGPADGPYQGPDLAKARQLVAESGTSGMPVNLSYSTSFPIYETMARYVASVLADLGYRPTLTPIPRGHGSPDDPALEHSQLTVAVGWDADYPSPSTFYDFVSSCHMSNFEHYCNPSIQAKADEARALTRTDPSASLAAWAAVDHMLVDDAAAIGTISFTGTMVVSPDVGNVLTKGGGPVLDQMWVK